MAEFMRVYSWKGFDKYSTPRWQMVPEGGVRYVLLRDGAGLTVAPAGASSVKVTELGRSHLPAPPSDPVQSGDRFFKIEGLIWSIDHLRARGAAGVVAELELDIKKKLTYSIAFNYVKDNAGHATTRGVASATGFLAGINWIYNGQSNVFFRQQCARNVTVHRNLGQVVRFSSHVSGVDAAQHEWDAVLAKGDPNADMNFFFVWEYEQDASPFTDNTDAGTLASGRKGNCIFEDHSGAQVQETLSHEIGHFLDCDDHYDLSKKHELMYGITDARGAHIGKEHANIMNY